MFDISPFDPGVLYQLLFAVLPSSQTLEPTLIVSLRPGQILDQK